MYALNGAYAEAADPAVNAEGWSGPFGVFFYSSKSAPNRAIMPLQTGSIP